MIRDNSVQSYLATVSVYQPKLLNVNTKALKVSFL